MWRQVACAVLVSVLLSGCFGDKSGPTPAAPDAVPPAEGSDAEPDGQGDPTGPPAADSDAANASTAPREHPEPPREGDEAADPKRNETRPTPPAIVGSDDRIHVALRVPVVLVGFEPGTADLVAARLPGITIDTDLFPAAQPHSDGLQEWAAGPTTTPAPAVYQVRFDPVEVAPETSEAFHAWLPSAQQASNQYDGNRIEAWLAEHVAPPFLDANRTMVIAIHLGPDHVGDHRLGYVTDIGPLTHVRILGERLPFLVYDASAGTPPGTGTVNVGGSAPQPPYASPVAAGGSEAAIAVATFAEDAVRYRVLAKPIHPAPTERCHDITVLLATRATSVVTESPDPDRAAAGWRALLPGEDMRITSRAVALPAADPALAALTRGDIATVPDALQLHLHENWDAYMDPRGACSETLVVYVDGDVADTRGGVGTYDAATGRRIALIVMADPAASEPAAHHPELILNHEVGHTFGLIHVQNGGGAHNLHFQHVRSVMHASGAVTAGYGAGDHANVVRERAVAMAERIVARGDADEAAFTPVLEALGAARWQDAIALALAVPADGGGRGG